MVFRGKPSKACQRCRDRKLRCDLRRSGCSPCLRVGAQCAGYRDTSTLRITDQTQTVQAKALSKAANPKHSHLPPSTPRSYALSLEVQARNLFFAYYIADFSRTWDFLYPFFSSASTPEHLSLSIDAVSLAFLSHQVYSSSALALSRQKYVSALRKTNTALQCPNTARKATTLDASLLLDLFENMTNSGIGFHDTNRAHVNGALALVKLRGLGDFTDTADVRALIRLILNHIISCVSKSDPVPKEIPKILEYAARLMDPMGPKWRLSGLMIEYTNLVSEMNKEGLGDAESVERCVNLDARYEELARNMPPNWMFEKMKAEPKSERYFGEWWNRYPNRTLTQTWNVLRLARILLCEEIVERLGGESDDASVLETQRAKTVIETMTNEICASVPQMTDCNFAAKHKLPPPGYPPSESTIASTQHLHTPSHYLDAYIMIYALYVAAWSRHCPPITRIWIVRELDHIASHFRIKEAALVRDILVEEKEARVGPWEVYRLLGSYAFAA
ncbi:putative C6 transcription factor [Lindgomyces ingoldianus]|uniref:C6 transcription factor n=1 Tax=Lindgomyces ingoldianus TaxID=673940 RepID=A0ACB6QPS4_9PLEO|nr:putative C6 transcription factor [Lindgomyces ingoldianus]KAF2468901.1 putative C6 transcription factor [Lindgomyces ingoldianus]